MRLVYRLLDALVVFIIAFGLLGSLLTGSKATSRALMRRASRVEGAQAWVSGFGGSMGWDGFNAAPSRDAASPADKRIEY